MDMISTLPDDVLSHILSLRSDMISTLPDDVLSHILSLLPSHCSMQTSFLSTRFRHVWKSVRVLDCDYLSLKKVETLEKLVDQWLENHENLWSIWKFHLICYSYDYNKIGRCVWDVTTAAVNLEEIDIHLHSTFNDSPVVLFPVEVFSHPKLKTLRLSGGITVPSIPTTAFLPSLINLHFNLITMLGDHQSFINLLNACPSFQYFYIKYLDIGNRSDKFNTLLLKDLNDSAHSIFATIHTSIRHIQLHEILNIISDRLSYLDMSFMPDNSHFLPKIQNLTDLKIKEMAYDDQLLWFLVLSPNLTSMVVKHISSTTKSLQDTWGGVFTAAPMCFKNKLERIQFTTFEHSTMEIVKYILKNALVLKEMIFCNAWKISREEKGIIWNAPRGSSQCKIRFIN